MRSLGVALLFLLGLADSYALTASAAGDDNQIVMLDENGEYEYKFRIIDEELAEVEYIDYRIVPSFDADYTHKWSVLNIPAEVYHAGVVYKVVRIADRAFRDMANYVVLPNTIRSIGREAFINSKIHAISIPPYLEEIGPAAFAGCTELIAVDLPFKLETIADSLFYGCSQLQYVEFPLEAKRIGRDAFNGCNIITAEISPGVESIGDNAFTSNAQLYSVFLPSELKSIGTGAFKACSHLNVFVMGDSVRYIGDNAFQGCGELKTLHLTDALEYLGTSAFQDCMQMQLSSPNFLKSIKVIGNNTFSNCRMISEINLPDGMQYIGDGAFEGCTGLNIPALPSSLQYIGKRAFRGCASILAIDVPENLDSIGESTFEGCCRIKEIVLSSRIKYIGANAFKDCVELSSINLPPGLKSIGAGAFQGCRSLVSVHIPLSIKRIARDTYRDCLSLSKVVIHDSLETVAINCLMGSPIKELHTEKTFYYYEQDACPENYTIPDGIVRVKGAHFAYQKNLKSLSVPESLLEIEHIGKKATHQLSMVKNSHTLFYGGREQKGKFVVPEGIKRINAEAFYESEIQEIVFPDDLNYIGPAAFMYSDLRFATIPEGVDEIHDNTFSQSSIYENSLVRVHLHDKIKRIGKRAFCNCLTTEIDNVSAEVIDDSAFYYCSWDVRPVEGVKYIGSHSFNVHTEFTVPSTVECMSNAPFMGVEYDGMELYMKCITPPEVLMIAPMRVTGHTTDNHPFKCVLYVPDESYMLYRTHDFWRLCQRIVPMSEVGIKNTEENLPQTPYYDLQGRPVANPTHGIYIKDGKKIAVD